MNVHVQSLIKEQRFEEKNVFMQLQMSFMFSTLENETRHINIGSQFTLELMTIHFMTNVYPGKEDLIKWHRCVKITFLSIFRKFF